MDCRSGRSGYRSTSGFSIPRTRTSRRSTRFGGRCSSARGSLSSPARSGTGKTLLCRTLLQELEPGACASIVLDPRVTIEDLLLHVLTDFGVISSPGTDCLGRRADAPPAHEGSAALPRIAHSDVGMRRARHRRGAGSRPRGAGAAPAAPQLRDRRGEAAANRARRPAGAESDASARRPVSSMSGSRGDASWSRCPTLRLGRTSITACRWRTN